jgi:GH43 family beta-xylosidase
VFSSKDLTDWRHEGIMLDLGTDQVKWADGNAWAPCIIEKKIDGKYKYFFYFSGNTPKGKAIGVATADYPTGPFTDAGHPIIDHRPKGQRHGQQIDVDVFEDPVSGKSYLYWGNGYMAGAELNEDMMSIKPETETLMTPQGGSLKDYAFREAPYVFYRKGLYYFLWSVDDTGSPNYHVAYGTSKSPLGPIEVAKEPVILIQNPELEIYGPAHNSVLQIPGKDKWYMVYHRINKNYIHHQPGVHREVCIDKMEFNEDDTIKPVIPTHEGVKRVK